MAIHLPQDIENALHAEVLSGHFLSVDDAVAQAVRAFLHINGSAANAPAETPDHKPIWEVFAEISAGIPDEEWDKLPTDGAEQHDHYIYGTPKRPLV